MTIVRPRTRVHVQECTEKAIEEMGETGALLNVETLPTYKDGYRVKSCESHVTGMFCDRSASKGWVFGWVLKERRERARGRCLATDWRVAGHVSTGPFTRVVARGLKAFLSFHPRRVNIGTAEGQCPCARSLLSHFS